MSINYYGKKYVRVWWLVVATLFGFNAGILFLLILTGGI